MKQMAAILVAAMMASYAVGQDSNGTEGAALEPLPPPAPQTTCPVMEGKRINPRLYVDYQGLRVYVCCNACVRAARKNPEKYLRKLRDQGIAIEKVTQLSSADRRP